MWPLVSGSLPERPVFGVRPGAVGVGASPLLAAEGRARARWTRGMYHSSIDGYLVVSTFKKNFFFFLGRLGGAVG